MPVYRAEGDLLVEVSHLGQVLLLHMTVGDVPVDWRCMKFIDEI